MIKIIADTHAAVRYLWLPEKLSPDAVQAMDDEARSGERIGVSAITLCEIVYLSEKGKIKSNALELFKEANKELKTALLDLRQVNELYESEKQTFTGRLEEKDKEIKAQKIRRISGIITASFVSFVVGRAIYK